MPYTEEGFYYDDSPGDYCREADFEARYDGDPGPDEEDWESWAGLEPGGLEGLNELIAQATEDGDEKSVRVLKQLRSMVIKGE